MRWTTASSSCSSCPAVVWVLAFTVFPLGYSLFISVHNVDDQGR